MAEQKVTLETDPAKARALGRKELSRYMVLDNYRNNWLRIGFSEAELANGGSDRFIDAMMLWGTADKVREGLRAHFAAGATQVCIQPVHEDGDTADARPHPDGACRHLTEARHAGHPEMRTDSPERRWPMSWPAAAAAG